MLVYLDWIDDFEAFRDLPFGPPYGQRVADQPAFVHPILKTHVEIVEELKQRAEAEYRKKLEQAGSGRGRKRRKGRR